MLEVISVLMMMICSPQSFDTMRKNLLSALSADLVSEMSVGLKSRPAVHLECSLL